MERKRIELRAELWETFRFTGQEKGRFGVEEKEGSDRKKTKGVEY